MSSTRPQKPAPPMAIAAWHAALLRDWPAARQALERLANDEPPENLVLGILGWLDTMLHAWGHTEFKPYVRLRFTNANTGVRWASADDVPHPEAVWAGRVAGARATGDEQAFDALMLAASTDNDTWSRHVWALLLMASTTYAHAPARRREGP